VETHGKVAVLLAQPVFVLEAKAVVQGEPRIDAPVVLRITAVVVSVDVQRSGNRKPVFAGRQRGGIAEEKRRERVAVRRAAGAAAGRCQVLVEIEEARSVTRVEGVDAYLPEIAADPERVRADQFRDADVCAGGLPV